MYPYVDLGVMKLSVFPIILVIAIFSCIFVYVLSAKYDNYYFFQIKGSSVYCMIGAGVVGKLLFIFTRITTPNLNIFERLDGFVFFGGLTGAIVGLYIYSKRKWDRFFDLLDVYASILPLGQAIGRIGCYCNGCCYGKYYTGFLAVRYVIDEKETQVFPTWFIESIFCFVFFLCMFRNSKNVHSGGYAAIYLMEYSLFRFVIEFFRGDTLRGIWNGMSTSQYISILVFFMGMALLVRTKKIKEKNLMIKRRK